MSRFCVGSAIGGLDLRYPLSTCGRIRLFRPSLFQLRLHLMQALQKRRPAREVLNAGVADAACSD